MPESRFSVGNWGTESQIALEENAITGEGGPDYPRLVIPIKFTLVPDPEHGKAYTLLWLKVNLILNHKKIAESNAEPLAEYSWRTASSRQLRIEVPVDFYRLSRIEEKRIGDIEFRLDGSALIAENQIMKNEVSGGNQNLEEKVEKFSKGSFQIDFKILQSHWINKVLPGLGYGTIKIIEVPIPEKIIPGIFQNALIELENAQKYFIEGDYDKVAGHCRNAVQLIPESLILDLTGISRPSFNDKVKKFSDQHLSNVLSKSKREALGSMMKAAWALTSKAHHPSPSKSFNRADAEAVMLITTALLAYVGKLLKSMEVSK